MVFKLAITTEQRWRCLKWSVRVGEVLRDVFKNGVNEEEHERAA